MEKQFTPCPACGAVGEVGNKCLFCGTTVILKEGANSSTERIPQKRTVTPQQYAEKISIYHNVEPTNENLLKVSIGKQYGLVNLNGDLVYPLGNDDILVHGNTLKLGYSKIDDEDHSETFYVTGYLNLETGMYANVHGFVKDKKNPKKLHHVDVENEWEPINTYTNSKGEVHSYDYAEKIVIEHEDSAIRKKDIYILHQGNECSLWITYSHEIWVSWQVIKSIKESYIVNENYLVNGAPKSQICVFEGLREGYEFKRSDTKFQIALRTTKDVDVVMTIGSKDKHDHWHLRDVGEIYNEWCIATGNRIDKITFRVKGIDHAYKLKYPEEESEVVHNKDNTKEGQEMEGCMGVSTRKWIIYIILWIVGSIVLKYFGFL